MLVLVRDAKHTHSHIGTASTCVMSRQASIHQYAVESSLRNRCDKLTV